MTTAHKKAISRGIRRALTIGENRHVRKQRQPKPIGFVVLDPDGDGLKECDGEFFFKTLTDAKDALLEEVESRLDDEEEFEICPVMPKVLSGISAPGLRWDLPTDEE